VKEPPVPSVPHRYQITAVCLGNICRSPIAETVLATRIEQAGLAGVVHVDSAGTGDWHVGGKADRRTIDVLVRHGYEIDHIPRQITGDWFAGINLVLAMDSANYKDLQRMSASSAASSANTTLRMLRSFDPTLAAISEPDPALDLPDPYYGTPADFEMVLQMVEGSADGVLDFVRQSLPA